MPEIDVELQSIKNRFGIIGNSPALNYALRVAMQVAPTDLTVLIMGESGVGKEVFSQIIHSLSARKHNPFIAVNCGAIPEGTIDSELFGHEKGSFTGAVDSRKGYFETVNGGTIFLDEIGEMPLGTQARLLRVLETGEFIRVGSSRVQKTDVRIIAATNKDLLELTQLHKFREDLYYRLNTVPIRVPPLRERKEDIPLLFRKFAIDFAERYRTVPVQLTPDAIELLINYPWRGNVRELKNVAEQISVLSQQRVVNADELRKYLPEQQLMNLPVLAPHPEKQEEFSSERDILFKLFFDLKKDVNDLKKMFFDLLQHPETLFQRSGFSVEAASHPDHHGQPSMITGGNSPIIIRQPQQEPFQAHEKVEESLSISEKEKELIIKALRKHRGKRKDAAMDLGISERTLYRKLKEYNIHE
ncbi:MAG: sigma-54 dependent transcriptional regulator [Thermoflavifilum sp.]|nr:sigma-54 dependent transcriptional regulator [Thermoflavifilum sp.]